MTDKCTIATEALRRAIAHYHLLHTRTGITIEPLADCPNPICRELLAALAGAAQPKPPCTHGGDPLCACGHHHLGKEVCIYCECDEWQKPAAPAPEEDGKP